MALTAAVAIVVVRQQASAGSTARRTEARTLLYVRSEDDLVRLHDLLDARTNVAQPDVDAGLLHSAVVRRDRKIVS